MEFKIRLVELKNGKFQVQRGQVEYPDQPCGVAYVKSWDVLYEDSVKNNAVRAFRREKSENMKDVVEVFEEFSYKVG